MNLIFVLTSFLEYEDSETQQHLEDFYEDIHQELSKFGEIEEMHICDNVGEHLLGNVYIKYTNEDEAQKALQNLNGRFYGGKPIYAELSPVTNFAWPTEQAGGHQRIRSPRAQ